MKTKIILSAVSLIAVTVMLVLSNQFTTATAAPQKNNDFSTPLQFNVYDHTDTYAVSGAHVELVGEKFFETQTSGSTGRVRFSDVPDGTYTLSICGGSTGKRYVNFTMPGGIGTDHVVLVQYVSFCNEW